MVDDSGQYEEYEESNEIDAEDEEGDDADLLPVAVDIEDGMVILYVPVPLAEDAMVIYPLVLTPDGAQEIGGALVESGLVAAETWTVEGILNAGREE